jgi:hypothetical protein
MDSALRLILRFVIVPLGYLAATLAGTIVAMIAGYRLGTFVFGGRPDTETLAFFGSLVMSPVLFVAMLVVWLPAVIGILIAEAFAIRTWIFHVGNGALSAWVGWQWLDTAGSTGVSASELHYVIAAGLAAGFAYWAVAGWNAGFWKPVLARAEAMPPAP